MYRRILLNEKKRKLLLRPPTLCTQKCSTTKLLFFGFHVVEQVFRVIHWDQLVIRFSEKAKDVVRTFRTLLSIFSIACFIAACFEWDTLSKIYTILSEQKISSDSGFELFTKIWKYSSIVLQYYEEKNFFRSARLVDGCTDFLLTLCAAHYIIAFYNVPPMFSESFTESARVYWEKRTKTSGREQILWAREFHYEIKNGISYSVLGCLFAVPTF